MTLSPDRKVTFKARPSRKVGMRGFMLYPKDYELVEDLAAHLGCSRSEAVRTAIRSLAAKLVPYDEKTPAKEQG